jgi:hypothetical protein
MSLHCIISPVVFRGAEFLLEIEGFRRRQKDLIGR